MKTRSKSKPSKATRYETDDIFAKSLERLLTPALEPCGCVRIAFHTLPCDQHKVWLQIMSKPKRAGKPIKIRREIG